MQVMILLSTIVVCFCMVVCDVTLYWRRTLTFFVKGLLVCLSICLSVCLSVTWIRAREKKRGRNNSNFVQRRNLVHKKKLKLTPTYLLEGVSNGESECTNGMLPEHGRLTQWVTELIIVPIRNAFEIRTIFGNAEHGQRLTYLHLNTLKQHRRNIFKGVGFS